MFNAPYAIKKYEKGRLYLDDMYINQIDSNSTISLINGKIIKLPKRL